MYMKYDACDIVEDIFLEDNERLKLYFVLF